MIRCPKCSATVDALPIHTCSPTRKLQNHWDDISVELALRNLESVSTATLFALGQRDIANLVQQARYELRKYKQEKREAEPCELSSDKVLEIMEGMCWTLRARFTDSTNPPEDYEWVVEGCSGIEMGRGGNIHLAVQDAYDKSHKNHNS